MFGQNFGGNPNGPGSFMDFMFFNEVMNGGQKQQKSKEAKPKRDWIDGLEELDALEDEDE